MLELAAQETEQDHKMGSGPIHPNLPFLQKKTQTNTDLVDHFRFPCYFHF